MLILVELLMIFAIQIDTVQIDTVQIDTVQIDTVPIAHRRIADFGHFWSILLFISVAMGIKRAWFDPIPMNNSSKL